MIDWNPVILAIIALFSTIIATLMPIMVKGWFDAHTAQMTAAKAVIEHNQLIAEAIVLVVQQTYGALTNSAKFQLAMQRALEQLPALTVDALKDALNEAVGTMHLVWGDAWQELKLPPETTPAAPAAAAETSAPPLA